MDEDESTEISYSTISISNGLAVDLAVSQVLDLRSDYPFWVSYSQGGKNFIWGLVTPEASLVSASPNWTSFYTFAIYQRPALSQ